MAINEKLIEIFKEKTAGVFLFLGSGFSRRYLGLEDWKGLLDKFCVAGQPFEYYIAKADGNYPAAARLLASDFNEYWWRAAEYKESVEARRKEVVNETSALRFALSLYLSSLDQAKAKNSGYEGEIELLSRLNVDGTITTNWDVFLEDLFPEYKVYIGQEELLFANPQLIGEIYKIHGCSTRPTSLILTDLDYADFDKKNAYLAAKLITIFVEHPIIFIGYSLSDPNITSLLRAISQCIGSENIEKLRRNLIFVQLPKKGESDNIADTFITIEGVQIPIVLVTTNDFVPIYEAIDVVKRKIPIRLLRFFKEQLYQLFLSVSPEEKISVIDIDDIDKTQEIEFVVGVGVASNYKESYENYTNIGIGPQGYLPINAINLFEDVINDNKNFDAKQIIEHVVPNIGKTSRFIPVHKYLYELGIKDQEAYANSGLKLDKWVMKDPKDFQTKSYQKSYVNKYSHLDTEGIIELCTPQNAAQYLMFLPPERIDPDKVLEFLKKHEEKLHPDQVYCSFFKKLAAYYEKIKWGW